MAGIMKELEVERVTNLVMALGWAVPKVEVKEGKLIVTLEKEMELVELEVDNSGS